MEPFRPWLLPMLLVAGGVLTVVQLAPDGSRRRPGKVEPNEKDRADALVRIRKRVNALLDDTFGGTEALLLTVEGADSLDDAYRADESVMLLGGAGSGKTTELLQLADVLTRRAEEGEREPLPVLLSLAGWGRRRRRPRLRDVILPRPGGEGRGLPWGRFRYLDSIRRRRLRPAEEPEPLLDWLWARAFDLYRIAPAHAEKWIDAHGTVLLLDGLDEVRPELRGRCVRELNELVDNDNKPFVVVACRTAEFQALADKPHLRRRVTVAPLSQEEVSRHLSVPLDDELRTVVDAPLWLRLAKVVSGRLDTGAGPDELRRHLLDAYVTELLDRRGGERVRLLRGVALLARMTRHTNDPDRIDPRVLSGRDAPVIAELGASLCAWVVPPALAGALVTGLILPLVLLFGIAVGVAGTLFAMLVGLALGQFSDGSYAVDPVAERPWRRLLGVVAGLATGVVTGGLCALVSAALTALPGPGRTAALGGLVGVAVTVFGDRPRPGPGLVAAIAVACGMWWFDLTDADFQHVLLVAVVGLIGCVATALIPAHAGAEKAAVSLPAWRISLSSIVLTAVLAAGVLAVAGLAGAPVDGPVGAALGGFVVSVLGGAVAMTTGIRLSAALVPLVRRAGVAWTGLLPVRLRPFLREIAGRGLVNATGDGFRFLHGLLRDHIARIDVLDGRSFQSVSAGERETALAGLEALLAGRPRPRPWIPPRIRLADDEPVTTVRDLAVAGGTVAVLGPIGSGTSTLLLDTASALLAEAQADPRRHVPLYLDLESVPARIAPVDGVVRPLTRWVVAQARERYGVTSETILAWLVDRRLVLLLDGHGHGPRATRTAAMVEEFLRAYEVPAVVAGWAGGPPPPHGSTVVTVEPLTRNEVEAALAEHPRAVEFLGGSSSAWAALDTVDRVRRVIAAAATPDPSSSYVDERFAGLPVAARGWYSGLTGRTGDVTEAAMRIGVLLPALMVAVALVFGLGPVAGIVAGLVTGVVARPPRMGWVSRLAALVAADALGFVVSGFARRLADGQSDFGPFPATDGGIAVATVLGLCVALVAEARLAGRMSVREVVPFVYAAALYLLFDGPTRMGTVWQTLGGVVMGGFMGFMLSGVGMLLAFAASPLLAIATGSRPGLRRRFERELVARRLVVRSPSGLRAADPLVERTMPDRVSVS
ncbi:NACHT domain-containing protein [Amycolatopsis sp. Hca4]|uniref:NACHT domain-containing protein n=1 Tax=Amycolatopsis sp. Hca4 TaxID=2742131 RepID=UPI001C379E94|nr:NACHT domain-containing protein [Amycolatopsis sp. Hca4]